MAITSCNREGVSATHLDWSMVPYVRKSFNKHYRDGLTYIENKSIDEFENVEDVSIDDERYTKNEKAYKYALDLLTREIQQAVEGMYHNLRN